MAIWKEGDVECIDYYFADSNNLTNSMSPPFKHLYNTNTLSCK